MSEKVILVVSNDTPEAETANQDLCAALRQRDVEPLIRSWDDPHVDWEEGRFAILRSVPNYSTHREEFLQWADSVPKLLNSPAIVRWNTDKHYLQDLEKEGLPVIPTTWLEPEAGLSKHQIHTRFPAHGDFVVKPAISSGGRGVGRYTSTDAYQRMNAIEHSTHLLQEGSAVMVQRYLEEVESHGEISMVYFNGIISHTVKKTTMLHRPGEASASEQVVTARPPAQEEWSWGEQIRTAVHAYLSKTQGFDSQILYNRVDLVSDGKGSFYVMEVSMVEGDLYLDSTPQAVRNFADAIAQRAHW